jgi:hypothetical protein
MAVEASKNFEVSATGGSGSSGQAAQYAAGIDNAGDFYELQTQAPMSKSGVQLPNRGNPVAPKMATGDIVPLDARTLYPEEGVDTGAAMGPNAGEEIMAAPSMLAAQNNEDIAALAAYMPFYAKVAESPNASNATRNWYRYIRSQIDSQAQ